MRRQFISIRSVGEFCGFLAIIVVGALATAGVRNRFSPPTSDILAGLVLILVAVMGLLWLLKAGPESHLGRSSSLAGLGGALGVLVTDAFLSGDQYIVVGAAIGAGVCAVGGLVWASRSASPASSDW